MRKAHVYSLKNIFIKRVMQKYCAFASAVNRLPSIKRLYEKSEGCF